MPKLVTQFDHDDQGTPLAPLVCSFLTYGQIGKVTFLGKLCLSRKISNLICRGELCSSGFVGYGIYDVPHIVGRGLAPAE